MLQDTRDKVILIRQRMAAAQSRQKSYADNRRWVLEFEVEDQVFLRISSMKGVMRFGKKAEPLVCWTIQDHIESEKIGLSSCSTSRSSKDAHCLSCFDVKKVHP
jgi:hypothetical protein